MTPSVGRTVHYCMAEHDVEVIRGKAAATGAQVNLPGVGDVFPLVITRVWNVDPGTVNGMLLLDGDLTAWLTSRVQHTGEGTYLQGKWSEPPRVP